MPEGRERSAWVSMYTGTISVAAVFAFPQHHRPQRATTTVGSDDRCWLGSASGQLRSGFFPRYAYGKEGRPPESASLTLSGTGLKNRYSCTNHVLSYERCVASTRETDIQYRHRQSGLRYLVLVCIRHGSTQLRILQCLEILPHFDKVQLSEEDKRCRKRLMNTRTSSNNSNRLPPFR
jgi:hypothetical protein